MNKVKVYVAGPLNDTAVNYLHNVHRMMNMAEQARIAGFSVFVPALDMLMGLKFGYVNYHDYFDNSQPWLAVADAMLLVEGWQHSEGTKKEMARAISLDIPVFESIYDMNNWFDSAKKRVLRPSPSQVNAKYLRSEVKPDGISTLYVKGSNEEVISIVDHTKLNEVVRNE